MLAGGISMFANLGIPELILILVVALVIFGPGKLPEIGKSFGKSIGEFKEALRKTQDRDETETKEKESAESK
jgi:sec-independent protein translocase protein TatA